MAVVVQIGTNNGNDHVLKLCKRINPSFVLLVEPFAIHEVNIHNNYVGIPHILEKVAITCDSSTEKTLYYHIRDGPSGHPNHKFDVASLIPEHLVKHNYSRNELLHVTVPTVQLNILLRKHSIANIDYLFIDAEGVDLEILKSIDMQEFSIKHIQIEHLHLDQKELYSFMNAAGYDPLPESLDPYGYDTLFRKR